MEITLAMILKNEGKTIAKAILSTLEIIDKAVIYIDETTTDNTREEIENVFGNSNVPYIIKSFVFKSDFSQARNQLLQEVDTDWILILDGHEYFIDNSIVYLKELKNNTDTGDIEIFDFTVQDVLQNIYFQQPRLFKSHIRYELPIHNVISQEEKRMTMPQINIIHDQPIEQLKARQKQRKEMNIDGLKKTAEKGDARSMYYLADTYQEAKDYKNAEKWFLKYIKISEFPHERYAARIRLAEIAQHKKQYEKAEKYLIDCFLDNTGLNEHLILLGDFFFVQKNYFAADFYYTAATGVKVPERFLIIYMDCYTWMPWHKKALVAMARNDIAGLREAINKGKQFAPDRPEFFEMEQKLNDKVKKLGLVKKPKLYIVASIPTFIEPILNQLNDEYYLRVELAFNPANADNADIIWCEWADHNAIAVSNYKGKAKKILRIHSYEVYSHFINQINFDAFDKIVFIAKHVQDYLAQRLSVNGLADRFEVINHGVDLDKLQLNRYKIENQGYRNNKIAYAGFISNKKGAMQLLMIAEELKDYEFHVAGKFQEADIQRLYEHNKPDNMFLYGWQNDLNSFYSDKTYFINCSPREGSPVAMLEAMACGLIPLTYNWVGVDEIFNNHLSVGLIWKTVGELKENINRLNFDYLELRDHIEQYYNKEIQYNKTIKLINSFL